ncbi:MAG: hypothetical protein WCK27_11570 [Verrucomicrobiota bacterium]
MNITFRRKRISGLRSFGRNTRALARGGQISQGEEIEQFRVIKDMFYPK